jgi:hypothetical protein
MRNQPAIAVLAAIVLSCSVSSPSFAREYRCSVTDPIGDPTDAPGLGFTGEAYQDMVQSGIERTPGAVVFSMEVAAPIPSAPQLRTPNGLLLWMWGMNTGSAFPLGYPLPPGQAGLLEFWVHLAWNGRNFYAEVIDRRPTVQGGVPVVTPVPFLIDGRTVKVIASPSLFDDPPEFRWGSTTWIWSTQLGSAGAHPVDRAPDSHVTTCTTS